MTYRVKISGRSYGDCHSSAIVALLSVVLVDQDLLWEQSGTAWVSVSLAVMSTNQA